MELNELSAEAPASKPCRILALDGGGAKGFYSIGVLKAVEAMVRPPLCKHFDLIFGTSTGAIIAALLGLGKTVDEIHKLYKNHVPAVMKAGSTLPVIESCRRAKSEALRKLADEVFGGLKFDAFTMGVGIVCTRWDFERPMIFKPSIGQAHGQKATFQPGFGCTISDAVQASCAAYPFFERKVIETGSGDIVELIDGGYCANNPTLYAIADALKALKRHECDLRVLSVGVGKYPEPKKGKVIKVIKGWMPIQLLQKTLDTNTESMDVLRRVLYPQVATVRVSEAFETPEMATDLLEHDLKKLNILFQRGKDSFGKQEQAICQLMSC